MTDHPVMNHTQYRLLGCFLLLVAASSTTSCDSPPRASLSPAKEEVHVPETAALDVIFPLSEQRQSRLETAVEHWRAPYDEEARLLRMSGKTYNPHSNLTEMPAELHPTRWSVEYASSLLDTMRPADRQRGIDIVDRVLPLQDTNPSSPTYGTWPYWAEEPLDQMKTPDPNWADFIGITLLEIRQTHRDFLPEALNYRIDHAIRCAAEGSVRRKVSPSYTNVALMSAFLPAAAGEALEDSALARQGYEKMRAMAHHTKQQGGFSEYSSTTYTFLNLCTLFRALTHVRDPEFREHAAWLHEQTWEEIGRQYHPPSGQWGGPHSRAYGEFLHPVARAALLRGAGLEVADPHHPEHIFSGIEHRLPFVCPPSAKHWFAPLHESREIVRTFANPRFATWAGGRDEETLWEKSHPPDRDSYPIIGTTFSTPVFSLGSVNRAEMWDQRRPLIAYWGTAENPAALRLRFLRDAHDFGAVQFFSAQRAGRVAAILNFSTNGGDRHLFMDAIKDGTFDAKSLRARFALTGAAKDARITLPDSPDGEVLVESNGVRIQLRAPFARLGDLHGRWETGRDAGAAWVDLVLLDGELRTVKLRENSPAALAFTLNMQSAANPENHVPGPVTTLKGDMMQLTWDGLEVGASVTPAEVRGLQATAQQKVVPHDDGGQN